MDAFLSQYDDLKKRIFDLLKMVKLRSHQEEILEEFYSQRHIFTLTNDVELVFVARSEYSPSDVTQAIDRELLQRNIEKTDELQWHIHSNLIKYECTQIQISHFEKRITDLKAKEAVMLQNISYVFRGDDLSVEEVVLDSELEFAW